MKYTAATILLSLVLTATSAHSESVSNDFYSVSFPKGWKVTKDKNGFVAEPIGQKDYEQNVSITSLNRVELKDQFKSCDEAELRENFFWFFKGQASVIYTRQSRLDGFKSFHAIGDMGEPKSWISAVVLCGDKGIVYFGAGSTISKADAVSNAQQVLESIKWQKQ
jgi:hypothetical protein